MTDHIATMWMDDNTSQPEPERERRPSFIAFLPPSTLPLSPVPLTPTAEIPLQTEVPPPDPARNTSITSDDCTCVPFLDPEEEVFDSAGATLLQDQSGSECEEYVIEEAAASRAAEKRLSCGCAEEKPATPVLSSGTSSRRSSLSYSTPMGGRTPIPLDEPQTTVLEIPREYLEHLFTISRGERSMVKLLTPSTVLKLAKSEQHPISLANEAAIYTYLSPSHASILTLLGSLHSGLVFPYHSLGPLHNFIHGPKADDGVPRAQVLRLEKSRMRWARGVVEGVRFLHENGVVWAGCETRHVLLKGDGGVVLCGFGDARMDGIARGGERTVPRLYKFEGVEGKGEYTSQDDLWDMGIVLYEMFARKKMWDDVADEEEKIRLYKEGTWPLIQDLGEMGQVILECWNDKFGNANELLTAVDEIAVQENDEKETEEEEIAEQKNCDDCEGCESRKGWERESACDCPAGC